MGNPEAAQFCYFAVALGFNIFYIVALAESPEVSEIPCGKVMWYTLCISTGMGLGALLMFFYNKDKLKNVQEQQSLEDSSPAALCFGCLWCIGALVNCSLLMDQVLNISSDCKQEIEVHNLFWLAVQIQAYSFLAMLGLIALMFFCLGFCAIIIKR